MFEAVNDAMRGVISLDQERHREFVLIRQRRLHKAWMDHGQINAKLVELWFQGFAHVCQSRFRRAVSAGKRKVTKQ